MALLAAARFGTDADLLRAITSHRPSARDIGPELILAVLVAQRPWAAVEPLLVAAPREVLQASSPLGPLLHLAAELLRADAVVELLGRGVPPALRDAMGATALHRVVAASLRASHGSPRPRASLRRIIHALVAGGCPIDATDAVGRTALHAASAAGNAFAIRILRDLRADLTLRDLAGRTAQDCVGTTIPSLAAESAASGAAASPARAARLARVVERTRHVLAASPAELKLHRTPSGRFGMDAVAGGAIASPEDDEEADEDGAIGEAGGLFDDEDDTADDAFRPGGAAVSSAQRSAGRGAVRRFVDASLTAGAGDMDASSAPAPAPAPAPVPVTSEVAGGESAEEVDSGLARSASRASRHSRPSRSSHHAREGVEDGEEGRSDETNERNESSGSGAAHPTVGGGSEHWLSPEVRATVAARLLHERAHASLDQGLMASFAVLFDELAAIEVPDDPASAVDGDGRPVLSRHKLAQGCRVMGIPVTDDITQPLLSILSGRTAHGAASASSFSSSSSSSPAEPPVEWITQAEFVRFCTGPAPVVSDDAAAAVDTALHHHHQEHQEHQEQNEHPVGSEGAGLPAAASPGVLHASLVAHGSATGPARAPSSHAFGLPSGGSHRVANGSTWEEHSDVKFVRTTIVRASEGAAADGSGGGGGEGERERDGSEHERAGSRNDGAVDRRDDDESGARGDGVAFGLPGDLTLSGRHHGTGAEGETMG